MNPQTQATQSAVSAGLPRCSHRTPAGRHCRAQARDSRSGLCPRHYFRPPVHQPDPTLVSELLGDLTEFQSASEVNQFLSRLLLLLAQDRLSPRRGAVMAYTCNLLLPLHAIDIENKIAADAPQEIIFDLPRPKRDDDDPPHAPPSHPTWHGHTATAERPQTRAVRPNSHPAAKHSQHHGLI